MATSNPLEEDFALRDMMACIRAACSHAESEHTLRRNIIEAVPYLPRDIVMAMGLVWARHWQRELRSEAETN